jgi:hypothetical protein
VDLEDVNDELRNELLSEAFRDKLIEVYARKAVEIPIENVTTVYVSAKFNAETFPHVELVGDIDRNTSENDSAIDISHEIMLFFHARGDDEETVHRMVSRFLCAVREYFFEKKFLPRLGAVVTVGDNNHSPFVAEGLYAGRPFIKSGTIQLSVRTIDG